MSIFLSGFNNRHLLVPVDYAVQCNPIEIQLAVHLNEEIGGDFIDDVVFSKEAFFWLSGSAWKTSSPGFPALSLEAVEKISSSSQGLAAISKDKRILSWTTDKWQPLDIRFPPPKRCLENASSNGPCVRPTVSCNAQGNSKFPKANEESLSHTPPSLESFSPYHDVDSRNKDMAKTRCKHVTQHLPCIDCNLFRESEDSFKSVSEKTFIDVRMMERRITLLDEAGDVWQGELSPAPQCRVEAFLLRRSVAEVAVGAQHCVLRTAHGEVFTCGRGMRGELGAGDVKHREAPAAVPLLQGVPIRKVVAGAWHCLALGRLGEVFVWGWNVHGQLGLPCKAGEESASLFGCDTWSPFRPCGCPSHPDGGDTPEVRGVHEDARAVQKKIRSQGRHYLDEEVTLNVKQKSEQPARPRCDSNASSGDEFMEDKDAVVNVQSTPVMLEAFGDQDVIDIAAGDQHSLFLLEDGVVWSCGWNKYGQCGVCWRGCEKRKLSPVQRLPAVRRVWAGFWCSAFLASET